MAEQGQGKAIAAAEAAVEAVVGMPDAGMEGEVTAAVAH